jgi:hypothetical protein
MSQRHRIGEGKKEEMKEGLIDRWEADALTRGLDPKIIKACGCSLKSIQETLGRTLSKMDKMVIYSCIDICRKENLTTRTIRSHLPLFHLPMSKSFYTHNGWK